MRNSPHGLRFLLLLSTVYWAGCADPWLSLVRRQEPVGPLTQQAPQQKKTAPETAPPVPVEPVTPPIERATQEPRPPVVAAHPMELKREDKPDAAERKKPPEKVASIPQKTPTVPEEPPTALQQAPGPKADDRLLDLLQKDLDAAAKEPAEPRQVQFSLPVVDNDKVRYFVESFSGSKRVFFAKALARSGRYAPMIAEILRQEELPEDFVYLALIESAFFPDASSHADAVGLWQFVRGTGLRYGLRIDWWVDERRDPWKSTRAAAAYLKDLHQRFGRWYLAAAAYNAGGGRVGKAMRATGAKDFWSLSRKSTLAEETRNFVPKFIAATLIAREPEKYGFGDIVYDSPPQYDEAKISSILKLSTIAELADTTVEKIRELNPALLRDYTPPSENGFYLRLPAGKGERFTEAYARFPHRRILKATTHHVKRGDTLWAIARRYGQRVGRLMEINGLTHHRIRPGQYLMILSEGPGPAR